MNHALFVRWSASAAASVLLFASSATAQQRPSEGSLAGSVVNDAGGVIAEAAIHVVRLDGGSALDGTSDASGHFTLRGLSPGFYRLTARRLGFHEAQLSPLRVIAGQTAQLQITLTASATQLSTVEFARARRRSIQERRNSRREFESTM